MNQEEKCELLKNSIKQLYSNEGRSRLYISNLLGLNRKILSLKIKEWNLEEPKPMTRIKPSTQKFINKNRQLIKSKLDKDFSIVEIAEEIGCTNSFLQKIITKDSILSKAKEDFDNRKEQRSLEKIKDIKENSKLNYFFEEIEGEEWVEILGFEGYYVSNMGRVKHYIKRYKDYVLLSQNKNCKNGKVYVYLHKDGKQKAYNLARLVGHAFCEGFSEEKNTIKHKDGKVENNTSENLEWVTQTENNKHSYDKLNRQKNRKNHIDYIILYKNKYRFKTITAFAKFIEKSPTQVRRYILEPEKHDIKLIPKNIDKNNM